MATKTKYRVGEVVWYRFVGKPTKAKVVEIIGGKEKLYRCSFYLTSATFRESELFPTEDELLNTL